MKGDKRNMIPIDLTKTPEVLPQAVYNILCDKVTLLDGEGNATFLEERIETISLSIKVISDDPSLEGFKKSFQHRLNVPLPADSADDKDRKIYFLKVTCDGFGVLYTESGFEPNDFLNKTAEALVVQAASKTTGQIFNNIKRFLGPNEQK